MIQDRGRFDAAHFGISQGGYFDRRSALIANWIVDNSLYGPLIETAGVGLKIRFKGSGCFAVTGARGHWTLNDKMIHQYQCVPFKANDILHLHRLDNGYRSYVAVGGKLDSNSWMGSKGCFLFVDTPFPTASLLKPGSELRFTSMREPTDRIFPEDGIPSFRNLGHIRILAGPEFEWFSTRQINQFLEEAYTVTNLSNRMGLRLDGNPLDRAQFSQMISSGILPGTIQINAQGLPMILGIGAQTMGGYPRIGVVAQADLSRVAQLEPGSVIRFRLIDQDDARQLSEYQEKRVKHFFDL